MRKKSQVKLSEARGLDGRMQVDQLYVHWKVNMPQLQIKQNWLNFLSYWKYGSCH